MPDGQPIPRFQGSAPAVHARIWPLLRLLRTQDHGHGAGGPRAAGPRAGGAGGGPCPRPGIRPVPQRCPGGRGLCPASEAAPLHRFSSGAGACAAHACRSCSRIPRGSGVRWCCKRAHNFRPGDRFSRGIPMKPVESVGAAARPAGMSDTAVTGTPHLMEGYNFAYLDEQTKRMVRRSILKAVAIPGHQVPFGSREMPLAYGWGTGGIQVTASILGPDDVLKVIDQGADDTTNAVSIRRLFERTAGVATTDHTEDATIIQTRHRVPEKPLRERQILVYQVPIPEPLRFVEPRELETRRLHALNEYDLMHLKLYEDIAKHGHIATTY